MDLKDAYLQDTSVSSTPTPPPVSAECHNLPVQMSPIQPNISTSGVYQGVKTGGRDWVVNLKKSHLTPEQSTEFLGFMVNSLTMKLILPAQKLKKIQQDAQRLLKLDRVSVRELARFLGKVSAASRAVWQAPLHYRALKRMVNAVIPESQSQPAVIQKFNVQVEVTREAMEDPRRWAQRQI